MLNNSYKINDIVVYKHRGASILYLRLYELITMTIIVLLTYRN